MSITTAVGALLTIGALVLGEVIILPPTTTPVVAGAGVYL